MKTYNANTWEEVKEALKKIEHDASLLAEENKFRHSKPSFLFRGQGNSDWCLETTLERVTNNSVLVTEYYRHILKTRPQVEAFSNMRWELIELQEYTNWAESLSDLHWPDYPGYEYMIYLRHHSFPSPLLDWSRSPYVAAYFAFTNLPTNGDNVAIYCYSETIGVGKVWSGGEPIITVKGPYARSHKRHFMQQCEYTICSRLDERGLTYTGHDEVFNLNNETQDLLWKIIVPRTVAASALKDLDSMNVNALSLMGSEDALIQTLAVREYITNGV